MFKKFIQIILNKLGYRIISIVHLNTIIEGPNISELDFHYFLKHIYNKDSTLTLFDIGANIGQTSIKLNKYFPNSKIYSFEPVKHTFETLQINVINMSNVQVNNIAIGDTIGEIEIYHRINSEWNSLNEILNEEAKNDGASFEKIKVITIDNFMKINDIEFINILKSDTEGFELKVLLGAHEALKSQKIEMIYIEVGFLEQDNQHTHWKDIFDFLNKYKYFFCGFFESSYGSDKKLYYANALFMSSNRIALNQNNLSV